MSECPICGNLSSRPDLCGPPSKCPRTEIVDREYYFGLLSEKDAEIERLRKALEKSVWNYSNDPQVVQMACKALDAPRPDRKQP